MTQLNKVTPFEFDCVPNHVKEIHMIHIPETKFFLGIPFWKEFLTKEELSLPALDYSFSANGIAYYKSKRCYELDELVGDPQTRLITEESNIIRSLAHYIKQNIHFTVNLIEMIGELDCIFAMAALAKENNYIEPRIHDEKIIKIENGLHPLLSRFDSPVIPNSVLSSSKEGGLINVIFGPNSSGKTVYLKQIAVHAYLCHIGSFLPAVNAQIGILNHIYTRISSTESILANSSSFMNELRRIVTIVNSPSSDSLVILDEVGKGTTESEGVAILAGCLNYFFSLGENSPHIIISTHLDSIKDYLNNDLFSAIHEMDYVLDGVDFSFLYTVKPGGVISHDKDISLFPLDVPDSIAIVAKEVLKSIRKGKDVIPCTNIRKQQTERICQYLEKLARIHPISKRSMQALKHIIFSFV
ncbi:mutS protein homolog 5-like [Halyomorpha halys]|uniref:mutS protein homolog 5-like n=1 Tax=Halyomorpha halys TaxID=286706 RepID=UPI0006D4EEE4